MDWVIFGTALGGAAAVGMPMLGWVLSLQGRLVAVETWRDIQNEHWMQFEKRITDSLDRIERKLDSKADK